SPCEKLSRTTSTPAWMRDSRTLRSREAGPMVATILVCRIRAAVSRDRRGPASVDLPRRDTHDRRGRSHSRSMPDDPLRATLEAALGDRYSVLRELGRGGMGAVFLAR